jgi:hypothetical protein
MDRASRSDFESETTTKLNEHPAVGLLRPLSATVRGESVKQQLREIGSRQTEQRPKEPFSIRSSAASTSRSNRRKDPGSGMLPSAVSSLCRRSSSSSRTDAMVSDIAMSQLTSSRGAGLGRQPPALRMHRRDRHQTDRSGRNPQSAPTRLNFCNSRGRRQMHRLRPLQRIFARRGKAAQEIMRMQSGYRYLSPLLAVVVPITEKMMPTTHAARNVK